MTAHLAADPDVAWLAAAAVVAWWLHRRGRLRSLTRRAGRLVAAVAAVVLAATVSTSAVVVVVAVIGCLAIGGRHTRRHTQLRRWLQHGYDGARYKQRHHRRRASRHGGNVAYEKWMTSPGWRRQKVAALEDANYRCAIRGCVGAPLEVHHNKAAVYKRLAKARPSDLTVLCVSHHRIVTDLHRYRGYTIEAATARVLRGDVYAA